jgi:hypothetical protein
VEEEPGTWTQEIPVAEETGPKVEQLVKERDAAKRSVEHIGSEGGEILQSPIMALVVTAMSEKSSQAHQQCQRITEIYDTL